MKYLLTITAFLIPMLLLSQSRESDSLALVQLYNELDGANWENHDTWLFDEPLETWKGVYLSGNRVNKLELKSTNAVGKFPRSVIQLDQLSTLEISQASISDSIPAELSELTKLSRLVLKNCELIGDLPPIFNNYSNLMSLILSSNQLTGQLPLLGEKLSLCYLSNNQFSGSIPLEWENNEKLGFLQINNNLLTGDFNVFQTFSSISSLNLSDNLWDKQTFPLWVDDITNLSRFSCDNCNLYGTLPSDLNFKSLENYDGMFVSDNDLSGDISLLFHNPAFGKKLYFRARNNNFSGHLDLSNVNSFSRFDIYNNGYSSVSELQNTNIEEVNVQYNNLTFLSLAPLQNHIALDSTPYISYSHQNRTLAPDTLVINSGQTLILESGDGHTNTTYQWYENNQLLEDQTEENLILEMSSTNLVKHYYCKMLNQDFPELELRSNTIMVNYEISSSTKENEADNVKVFPNPTNGTLTIITKAELSNCPYQILDRSGRIIQSGSFGNYPKINLHDFNKGTYVLRVIIKDNVHLVKVIKL